MEDTPFCPLHCFPQLTLILCCQMQQYHNIFVRSEAALLPKLLSFNLLNKKGFDPDDMWQIRASRFLLFLKTVSDHDLPQTT